MSNVASSCCCCSIGIAWALARKSHSIRGRKWCQQQQQTVCRQGREWACLMCCFFFASLLHLPLPPPHPKRCPVKLCIPAVEIAGFHPVSFTTETAESFYNFYLCVASLHFSPISTSDPSVFVTFPAALTGSTFRLMSHTRSFMRSCWQLWKRRVGLLWNEKATKGNRC